MLTLTPQSLLTGRWDALQTGIVPTYSAVPSDGVAVANNGNVLVHVRNGGASATTVRAAVASSSGGSLATPVDTVIAAGSDALLGPFPYYDFRPAGNDERVLLTFPTGVITSVTVAAFALGTNIPTPRLGPASYSHAAFYASVQALTPTAAPSPSFGLTGSGSLPPSSGLLVIGRNSSGSPITLSVTIPVGPIALATIALAAGETRWALLTAATTYYVDDRDFATLGLTPQRQYAFSPSSGGSMAALDVYHVARAFA